MSLTPRWSLRLPRLIYRPIATASRPRTLLNPCKRTPSASQTLRRQKHSQEPPPQPNNESSKVEAVSTALSQVSEGGNSLLTPVYIPEDPNGVLKENHPAISLLDNSSIVVQRQLEMMNVLMGFEQANRYVIMDPQGNHIGYLAEQEHGMGNAVARQMFRTHRSFTTHVFDRNEKEVLRFHRPFSWISSRIRVYDALSDIEAYSPSTSLQGTSAGAISDQSSAQISSIPLSQMRIIGSAEQEWAPLRRKYNLFLARSLSQTQPSPNVPQLISGNLPLSNSKALQVVEGDSRDVGMLQFARVDEPWLSWDFTLLSEDQRLLGSVNRNFVGFAREIFTDTGVYALRMDAASLASEPAHLVSKTSARHRDDLEETPGMTLDQRAVMLATAVSIDFDYFSRKSNAGGVGWMPLWFPMGGEAAGGAAEAGAVGAGAGEAGTTVGEAGSGAIGSVGRGVGGVSSSEGAAAGVGTIAGYEAMQRGRGAQQEEEENPDRTTPIGEDPQNVDDPWASGDGSHWFGDDSPPDTRSGGGSDFPPQGPQGGEGGGGGGGGGEGGGWMDSFGDFFGGD